MSHITYIVFTLFITSALNCRAKAEDTALYLGGNRNGRLYTVSKPRGNLVSHLTYGNKKYANNINSSITLTGLKADQRVVISFSGFEIYRNVGVCCCLNDYLQISGLSAISILNIEQEVSDDDVKFCSDTDSAPPIGQYITLTVKRDQITFKFVTDSIPRTRDDGFKLSYEAFPISNTTSTSATTSTVMKATGQQPSTNTSTQTSVSNQIVTETPRYFSTSKILTRPTDKFAMEKEDVRVSLNTTVVIIVCSVGWIGFITTTSILVAKHVRNKTVNSTASKTDLSAVNGGEDNAGTVCAHMGGINNPIDYEEVGLDLFQVNPAIESETVNQSNVGASPYENIGGNIQTVGGEYEMVRQGEGNDHHLYTSLSN